MRPGEEAALRAALPHWVYEFIARDGSHLYVGCTSNLHQRIANHSSEKKWFGDVTRIEVDQYPDQRSALDAERALIEQYQPKHNSVHTDRFDAGGWTNRRAKMKAAHAAGELCRDKTCKQDCNGKAHAARRQCSRNYNGCDDCRSLEPYLDAGVDRDCWRELARHIGGGGANHFLESADPEIALVAYLLGLSPRDLGSMTWPQMQRLTLRDANAMQVAS